MYTAIKWFFQLSALSFQHTITLYNDQPPECREIFVSIVALPGQHRTEGKAPTRVGQNCVPYMYTVYDCMYENVPAKNIVFTIHTVYKCTYLWFWPTLFMPLPVHRGRDRKRESRSAHINNKENSLGLHTVVSVCTQQSRSAHSSLGLHTVVSVCTHQQQGK
jgi:hypothetical protein